MRARLVIVLIAAIMMAGARGAAAQATTADGVVALARGDHQRAVEILRPIAEDWRTDDAAALFFMAGLYETGRGVSADPLRSCALYARASWKSDHAFGRLASALFAASLARGVEFNQECQLLANAGLNTGFEPVTFHFGSGHFIEWTLSALTLTYEGRTKRELLGLAEPGVRFLPLQQTELATGPTRAVERHFIEAFVWQPWPVSGQWKLRWHLYEVVRDEIIPIATPGELVAIDGDAPPARDAFDVRDYAVLRVDDDGNAEWAVLKGPKRATRRIESEAERREERDAELAGAAALKRVDWKRRSDVLRQPTMIYPQADGCGLFHLYGWTANRDEVIFERANARELGLATPETFDLAGSSASISIETYVYDSPRHRFDFCTDVYVQETGAIQPEIWRAVSGMATIELSPPGIRAAYPSARRVTVTLSNVVLRNTAGTVVRMPGPVKLSAIVRGMAG
jgi:hypothetical protein